jgi:hypothetical protein
MAGVRRANAPRTDIVFVGRLRDKLTQCTPRQRSGIFIGGTPAASLEFNHRAMSLKSIGEKRNDHLSFIATDR